MIAILRSGTGRRAVSSARRARHHGNVVSALPSRPHLGLGRRPTRGTRVLEAAPFETADLRPQAAVTGSLLLSTAPPPGSVSYRPRISASSSA